jgi:hypothetical protein
MVSCAVVRRVIGISVHTGWAACVVVGGTRAKPTIVANQLIDVLDDSERFCFHMAAEMKPTAAEQWIAAVRKKALTNAKRALAPLLDRDVKLCAVVAKAGEAPKLADVLASHPRIHTAEGCFYRDVFREACGVPSELVPPSSLDVAGIGKLAGPPWGKDQKLAALAAWRVIER